MDQKRASTFDETIPDKPQMSSTLIEQTGEDAEKSHGEVANDKNIDTVVETRNEEISSRDEHSHAISEQQKRARTCNGADVAS